MSNIVEAEYTMVQERTLPVIVSEIKIIEQNTARIVLENGIQIGQRLQEAKEKVGHGGFGDWCQENLNYSQDTAQKFMRLAKEYGGKNNALANTAISRNFSISNALSLLKVPEEDRKKFAEEHPIEDMTNKELEDEIRRLKTDMESQAEVAEEEKDMLRRTVRQAQEEANEARRQIEDLKRQLDEAGANPETDRAAKAAMQSNIDDLKKQLAESNEKLEATQRNLQNTKDNLTKEKEKLKKEKAGRQAAIDQSIGNQRQAMEQEIRKEAEEELTQAKQSIAQLLEQIDILEKRAANAGSESKLYFKVLMDDLQTTFHKVLKFVESEPDPKTELKFLSVLVQIMDNMKQEAAEALKQEAEA